jgi:hypothetical protein
MNGPKLDDYFEGLRHLPEGYWVASDSTHEISFPKDGHAHLHEIESESFWFKFRNNYLVEVLNRFNVAKTILDVGGGNGFVSAFLSMKTYQPILVEPGDGAYTAAHRGLMSVIKADVFELKIRKPFAAVGCFDVVEHIEDDLGFLKRLHSISALNAHIVLTVPAFRFLWSAEDKYAGHFRRYTKSDFAKLLQQAGFEPIYSSYLFSFLVLPIFFLRTLPTVLGFQKDNLQRSTQQQHTPRGRAGIIVRLFQGLHSIELALVKRGASIPFGTSLIYVAQKKH